MEFDVFKQYLVIAFSLLLVVSIVVLIPNTSILYKVLSVLNASISTLFLFTYRERPYSLHKMVNLFLLFFFVIANAIQFSTNTNVTTFPITICADDKSDYERFQFLVLGILLLFNLSYPFFKTHITDSVRDNQLHLSNKRLIFFSFFSLLCTVFYYRNAILLMFVRGLSPSADGGEMADLGGGFVGLLLFDKVIRALPFACYVWAEHYKVQKSIRLLLLFLMLMTLFPTALARNATAMYWLPVAFLAFSFMRRENVFVLTMLVGLLVIFPFLDNFRWWGGEIKWSLSFDFLNQMHFDASQNFMIIMKLKIVTWGQQLLGALLFWFPRSLWESKPLGSGAFVAEQYSDFTNISMPWFAEGYLNFGFIGIILFTLFLSWFSSFFDSKYWNDQREKKTITPYYLLLISSLLYILRGDLMSSLAYTLATLFDIYIIYRICTISSMKEKVAS